MIKILIIEDEEDQLEDFSELLEKNGFRVIPTRDGMEGVKLARVEKPDLILCDIHMPSSKYDGFQVLQQIKLDEELLLIPFIFMTAHETSEESRRTGIELGADDYLYKPLNKKELLNAINVKLYKHKIFMRNYDDLKLRLGRLLPHEMRTPLSQILGYSEILKEDYRQIDSLTVRNYGNIINQHGLSLLRLFENYLYLISLEELSDTKDEKEVIDIWEITPQTILDEVTMITKYYDRLKDVNCKISSGRIKIKRSDFFKILEELLLNAIKFSLINSRIEITSFLKEEYWVLRIKDNGIGIPSNILNNIEAFKQFNRDQYEQQGLGLGLKIVKRLVDNYGAQLDFKSELKSYTQADVIFRNYS